MNVLLSLVLAAACFAGQKNQAIDGGKAEVTYEHKIAVIDTGYDPQRATAPTTICRTGHYDYHTETPNVAFIDPHGTYVINVLAEKLKGVSYCLLIYQVFTDATRLSASNMGDAIDRALAQGATEINISIAGLSFESGMLKEAMRKASTLKVPIFVAAGNQGINLDKNCYVHPACYHFRDVIVVGAQSEANPHEHASISNYGKKSVDIWAPGYYDDGNVTEFGTSFAAPRALAEYVMFLEFKRSAAQRNRTGNTK